MNFLALRVPLTVGVAQSVRAVVSGLVTACVLSAPLTPAYADGPAASWTALANRAPGGSVSTMMLLSDGTVFAQSGDDVQHWFQLTPDAHGSYVNGTWKVLAPMILPRLYFASTVLQDGRVWVLGGEYTGPYFDASWGSEGEIYDPIKNTWSPIAHYPNEAGGCFPIGITSDVGLTAGSTKVTGVYSTSRLLPGWTVSGTGIPAGATVVSVDSPTQVTLSASATASGAVKAVVFSGTPLACLGDEPSALLSGGKILVGNLLNSSTYTYSIASNSWTQAADKVYPIESSDEEGWARMSGGLLLTYDLNQSIATGQGYAEVYDPAANLWSSISPPDGSAGGTLPLLSSTALGYELGPVLRLQDGRAFQIGANQHTALYDQKTNSWSAGPDIHGVLSNAFGSLRQANFGADDAPAALLPNGHVLLAADAGPNPITIGGNTAAGSAVISGIATTAGLQVNWPVGQADGNADVIPYGAYITSIDSAHQIHLSVSANTGAQGVSLVSGGVFSAPTELFDFDPKEGTISPVKPALADANLATSSAYVTRLLVLPNGQVLFNDGVGNQLYAYTPSGSAEAAYRPVIESIARIEGGGFKLTGLQLNGPSDASAYGDDVQSSENFPIVRLQNAAGMVFYARSTNWTSTGVGNVGQESVDFALSPAVPTGEYQLTVSAGGIASAPMAFHLGDE